MKNIPSTFPIANNAFGLYLILEIEKGCNNKDLKKAYKRKALAYHPDKHSGKSPEMQQEFKEKFQIISWIYSILNDEKLRKAYDAHGSLEDVLEDCLDKNRDWFEYWRNLFPKITKQDIMNFENSYHGSKEEREELLQVYRQYRGDMNILVQVSLMEGDTTMSAEDRMIKMIESWIKDGKVEKYDEFVKSTSQKQRTKRKRKRALEEKQANEQEKMADPASIIKKNRKKSNDDLIHAIRAKYASKGGSKNENLNEPSEDDFQKARMRLNKNNA